MTTRDDAGPNAAQVAYWNTIAGETWAALQDRLDHQIEPLGRAAMTRLAPRGGERIIDIGCGCGQTTIALARAVGPAGDVCGVDVSRPMLGVAQARTAAEGVAARYIEADAQTFAFEAGGADAVFSRFGVMFFTDPAAAFANIRSALKPGGRLAFVCWRSLPENPWMAVPLRAAQAFLAPTPPLDPTAPGPFAFADRARVESILKAAGFASIEIAAHDAPVSSGDLEQTVATALRIGPLGALLRDQPDKAAGVVDAIRAALAPYVTAAGVEIASATWIVTARAP
jgi:SAM-dependent methyltransferase